MKWYITQLLDEYKVISENTLKQGPNVFDDTRTWLIPLEFCDECQCFCSCHPCSHTDEIKD